MCGICGILNFNKAPALERDILRMMNAMKHRGPDADGVFIYQNIGLGFVRLSILDLSDAGNQPMHSRDGSHVIVFNGEIFNYIELRDELRKKGYHFTTQTDTEVVLAAYQEWGYGCQKRFIGMWAFAIYSKSNQSLFISRDRFGIKPFYYYANANSLIFASEIAPLLKIHDELREPNDSIIYDFLISNRTNHTNETFFKKINKLQHGSYLRINNTKIADPIRWYDLSKTDAGGYKNPQEFRNDFIRSLKIQLRSDVPIGICLSGGIDSSSIATSVSKLLARKDIHSFSAVYGKGITGDETDYINELEGYIDNIHFARPSVNSFLEDLANFIETQQEPVSSTSVYAEFKVIELARHHNCTVLLNGQGADEYLAGYHYFIGFLLKQRILEKKWLNAGQMLLGHLKKHRSFLPLLYGLFFFLPSRLKLKLLLNKNHFLSKDFFNQQSPLDNVLISNLYGSNTLKEAFINHFEHKFEHHLLWADKNGMKFSLETRFPFLDHLIVEKMLNTDTDFIYKNGVTKVILRQAMKGIIPEKVRTRLDKVGYSTPEDTWFRDRRFQELFKDATSSLRFGNRGYFDTNLVKNLLNDHVAQKRNNSQEIWKIFNLELWFRSFIDS